MSESKIGGTTPGRWLGRGDFMLGYAGILLVLLWVPAPAARAEIVLQEKVTALPVPHLGPFVRAPDGSIWCMDEHGARVSRDEGRTWVSQPAFDSARFQPRPEGAFLCTREGVLVYAFLNERERVLKWEQQNGGPQPGCRLPVYITRSVDGGKTWSAPFLLQDGWCGAVRQMIQLRPGRVLLICQQAVANPGRHITINYFSDDLGKTWSTGDRIDLGKEGGYGTHGGGIEGTVLERRSGQLLLLLRTPQGCFQEFTSSDGAKWTGNMPSPIQASDAPGTMMRLASGRVVLLWNRYRDPVKRSGRREELSIAFSENDGVTWTFPQIIATNHATAGQREAAFRLSYPYVFEPTPGLLWISTMQGGLRAVLHERDFVTPVERPLESAPVRIITLGDSITRGVRRGVKPTQTFAALLEAGLRQRGVRADVHDVGIGGERTDQALARLERDVISQRPRLVTVMYGTNDSWVDEGRTESRVSGPDYTRNLRSIIERLRAAKVGVVLMTAPRFAEENRRNGLGDDPNGPLARYMELCRGVARETGTPLVDHFAAWTKRQADGQRLQSWTTDGCHPNPEGHADLARRLIPVVETAARKELDQP